MDNKDYETWEEFDEVLGWLINEMVEHGYSIKELEFLENWEPCRGEIDESPTMPIACDYILEYAILDKNEDVKNKLVK